MIKLYAVRHAEAKCNVKDFAASTSEIHCGGLTELGKKQAEKLVPVLSKNKYDVIIVSPMVRAIETLIPYLKTFTYPPKLIFSDLVLERNIGELRGKPIEEVKQYRKERKITDRVSWRPPNGESLHDLYDRAKKFIKYLKENFDGKTVLVFSHGIFLKTLGILINNDNMEDFYSTEHPENTSIKEFTIK
jgi:broad specificity phosphatase PhoE